MKLNVIHNIDVISGLKSLPDGCVNCCVTSPPYWALRNYGIDGQAGMEATPEEYVSKMTEVFREVKRVLSDDGTLWLNIGDTYFGGKGNNDASIAYSSKNNAINQQALIGTIKGTARLNDIPIPGLKPKDLIGIPWMLAFALRADGWYLRKDIIWNKKNCMPESVTDRPTSSHEYIFLLSKSRSYYYDHESIKEPALYDVDSIGTTARKARQKYDNKLQPTERHNGIRSAGFKDAKKFDGKNQDKQRGHSRRHAGFNDRWDKMTKEEQYTGMRNKRDVWTMATAMTKEAHFATFPEQLPATCIKAGSSRGGGNFRSFHGIGHHGGCRPETR